MENGLMERKWPHCQWQIYTSFPNSLKVENKCPGSDVLQQLCISAFSVVAHTHDEEGKCLNFPSPTKKNRQKLVTLGKKLISTNKVFLKIQPFITLNQKEE